MHIIRQPERELTNNPHNHERMNTEQTNRNAEKNISSNSRKYKLQMISHTHIEMLSRDNDFCERVHCRHSFHVNVVFFLCRCHSRDFVVVEIYYIGFYECLCVCVELKFNNLHREIAISILYLVAKNAFRPRLLLSHIRRALYLLAMWSLLVCLVSLFSSIFPSNPRLFCASTRHTHNILLFTFNSSTHFYFNILTYSNTTGHRLLAVQCNHARIRITIVHCINYFDRFVRNSHSVRANYNAHVSVCVCVYYLSCCFERSKICSHMGK